MNTDTTNNTQDDHSHECRGCGEATDAPCGMTNDACDDHPGDCSDCAGREAEMNR